MESDNNLFQGRPLTVEEGPMNYHDSNKYLRDRRERQTTFNRFIQIAKVIFYIELIIVLGWFGYVLISEYSSPRNYDERGLWINTECQKSDVSCTVYEIDNARLDIKIKNRRESRSINDVELARERCQRSINTTLRRFDDLANRVVIGEITDPNVVKLRQRFVQEMIFLTLHVIFVQSNDTLHAMDLTNDEWNAFAIGIKQVLLNTADLQHRIRLEADGPMSQEISNEIRNTVESMASDYMNCETILPTPRLGNSKGTKQQALRLVEIVLERKRCANSLNSTQEKLLELTTQIVTGESTDPVVIKLRKDAKNKLMSVPHTFLGDIRDETIIKTGLANLTDANWRTILVELKKELSTSTDLQHQQQLEASGPPTPEMVNELRDIVEYFLIDHRKCEKLYANMLSAGKVQKRRQQARRSRRASEPLKYSKNDCLNDEKELLKDRRARLESIANADLSGDPSKMRSKEFLDAVEAALNSTSPSEVTVTDDLLQNDYGLIMWKEFLSNSSLEIKKEFYELVRDEFLELRKERSEPAVWEGYDLMSVFKNFTDSMSSLVSSHEHITSQDVLNIIVQCGKSLNFHYLEVENKNASNDSTIPMFGTLVYLDEDPEKLGVQHMRHILNGYVRLFFRALNAPSPCNAIGESQSNGVISEATNQNQSSKKKRSIAKRTTETINSACDKQQDQVLLDERRARLQEFANRDEGAYVLSPSELMFLNALETALNATSTSNIHFDKYMQTGRMMPVIVYMMSNASLELHKECYNLIRDLVLEFRKLQDHSPDWEGRGHISDNLTSIMRFSPVISFQSIFDDFIRIGRAFDLRYVELENRNSGDESSKPIFGHFTYIGENPEPPGILHTRHIFDGFVKVYFKVQSSSTSNICDSDARDEHSMKKRSAPADLKPKPINSACRDKQQDQVLLDERRARLEEFANMDKGANVLSPSELMFLNALETALNATSTSDTHFDNFMESGTMTPVIVYMLSNASLELHKECYNLIRDLFLEFRKLRGHSPDWEGRQHISGNLTSIMRFSPVISYQSIFDDFIRIGRAFDLRYVELENRNSGDESSKPIFGHFTYIGENPEPPGIRHTRHILDGFVKVYFKVQSTSTSNTCDSDARDEHSMKKRSAPADLKPKPITTMCWSKEQETVLLEERRQRLEAFALNNASGSTYEKEIQRRFFNAIESALNATSTLEIRFEDEIINSSVVLGAIHYLVADTSLELHKEGYELCRDLFIEMYKLNDNDRDWEGYNIDNVAANLSSIEFVSGPSMTAQKIFTNFVNFGKAFNLRYVELEIRDSEDEPNKLVFGKFINLGEKPEKSGVRNLRHILDGFVRFYFKTQYPSRPKGCNSRESPRTDNGAVNTSTPEPRTIKKRDVSADPVSKSLCRNQAEDAFLLEERRERLEAFAKKNATNEHRDSFTQNYLNAIQAALNAKTISEMHFDENLVKSTPMLSFIQYLVANSSFELHKEGYEFSRDLYLEMLELRDRSPAWEGYDEYSLIANITQERRILFSRGNSTAKSMFKDYIRFGEAFNLRYDEFETRDIEVESNTPALGKFTYLGEEPEKLGSRRLRHILDGFVKFYFKTQNPSFLGCNTSAQPSTEGQNEILTPETRSLKKRSVTAEPAPVFNKKCWSLEQDDTLLQERRGRLEAFANRNATTTMRNKYVQNCLESIEVALNATSVSEIHFDENLLRSTPALMFMEALAVNSSLELRKEGYEFARDLYLEMIELSEGNPDWEGYDENSLAANISEHLIFNQINVTSESIFNDFLRFGQMFNLRYDELATRNSDIDSSKPVFGKFTYLGEEPEKLGVRRLRHILDSFVKIYFKIQNPSSVACNTSAQPSAEGNNGISMPDTRSLKKRSVTAEPAGIPIKKCWSLEQDDTLLQERRERLEAFANRNATTTMPSRYMQNCLESIEVALNATSVSEIHFDEDMLRSAPALMSMEALVVNSSLELRKEGYEFARDLYLEMIELSEGNPDWEGYDENTLKANISDNVIFNRINVTSESIFNDFRRFGQIFNLRYDELATRNSEIDSSKPVFGKFTYLGEEPEKLGLRRLRHILDSFVKVYFKIQNPSSLACNTSAQPSAEEKSGSSMPDTRSLKKRYVTAQPTPAFFKQCWSLEQDDTFLQERRERLETFANRNATTIMRSTYMQNCLESIDVALNATNVSEIHFDEEMLRSAPALRSMEALAVNSSLELRKESYEFVRDLYLEMIELSGGNPDWEGYDENTLRANISETVIFNHINVTSESIFNDFLRFGQIFNLRYDELATRNSEIDSSKPVFGKFKYLGEEPEKLGVRRMRHILDSFVNVYFKIQNPVSRMICNPTVKLNVPSGDNSTPTPEKHSIVERMG